ncbi:MAG: UDP-3-O-acyl-N-acetylglucosamine deacetylase [Alphaproteobacteria bacterium]
MTPRKTLASEAVANGVALHAGVRARLRLLPAPVDAGIVFRRGDLANAEVAALWSNVSETRLGTVISGNGASVGVVEHLLSALAGAEVDDCIAEVDGPEPPILDGDSLSYLAVIERAGVREHGGRRKTIRVQKPVRVGDDAEWAELEPAPRAEFHFEIEFPTPVIGRQKFEFAFSPEGYRKDIAPARTFGFLKDAEKLRAAGFARGSNAENTLVLDGERIVNAGLQRFRDEFVRHKILDAIGDLKLAGAPICGRYEARRASHKLNNSLLRALFADPANYEIV